MKLSAKFPEFYKQLIPEILEWDYPDERFANCSNCHLCSSDKLSISQSKCCTYHAVLPNYIVGAILNENAPEWHEGRRRIMDKIENKIGVSPYGITGGNKYVDEIERGQKLGNTLIQYQRSIDQIMCPYLDNGKCTVWKYRSELCITYFCHPVSGIAGSKFWSELYGFVRHMERILSIYALRIIGFEPSRLNFNKLKHQSHDVTNEQDIIDIDAYDKMWLSHENEIELFSNCFEVIKGLNPIRVRELLGSEGIWRLDKCKNLLKDSRDKVIPDGLVYDKQNVVEEIDKDEFRIHSRTGDSIDVNYLELIALKMFDGQVNVTDILRNTKLIGRINSRKLHSFIQKSILAVPNQK